MSERQIDTIQLYAGARSDGSAVYEEVSIEALGGGRFRLLRSPGLVQGLAAGDVFEVGDGGHASVQSRGGNLAIQVFAPVGSETLEDSLRRHFTPLLGRVDGASQRQIVLTVPVSAGFVAVERALHLSLADHAGASWYYANVYEPSDGTTPLNWWK